MTSNIQYTFLAEIRPWTITQADIEGYETIHADGEIVLGEDQVQLNRKVSIWVGDENKINVDAIVKFNPQVSEAVISDSSIAVIEIPDVDNYLDHCYDFISNRKFKTIAFQYPGSSALFLLSTVKSWFIEGRIQNVERIIFCVHDSEQDSLEERMVEIFPPCYDMEFYVDYWETEKKAIEDLHTQRAKDRSDKDNVDFLFDMHNSWKYKLDEALRISREED